MTPFEVYKAHLALRLHFTSKYDYHAYNGEVKAVEDKFLANKSQYQYKKIAKRYGDESFDFVLANIIEDPKRWIGAFDVPTYELWRAKTESLLYHFEQQISALFLSMEMAHETMESLLARGENQHPKLVLSYFSGDISLETMVLFNSAVPFLKVLSSDPLIDALRFKVMKYQPFLKYDNAEVKATLRKKARLSFGGTCANHTNPS